MNKNSGIWQFTLKGKLFQAYVFMRYKVLLFCVFKFDLILCDEMYCYPNPCTYIYTFCIS